MMMCEPSRSDPRSSPLSVMRPTTPASLSEGSRLALGSIVGATLGTAVGALVGAPVGALVGAAVLAGAVVGPPAPQAARASAIRVRPKERTKDTEKFPL